MVNFARLFVLHARLRDHERIVIDLLQFAFVVAMVALATFQLVGSDPLAHPPSLRHQVLARSAAALAAQLGGDFLHSLGVLAALRADPAP